MKKVLSILFAAFTAVCFLFPASVLAVNEDMDDPEDGIVSQNEAHDDLLNEHIPEAPSISGSSYILLDCQADTILLGSNINAQIEPAAVTKLMTVLIALEELDLDDTVTITLPMYIGIPENYYTLGVTEGEQLSVRDLIYATLLESDNDACLALAIKVSGAESLFVGRMNERASELGCTGTVFTNCYGNDAYGNLSTAHDLALILAECTEHQDFMDISTTFQHTIAATNLYSESRIVSNANRFVSTQEYSYDYYTGGLTGYADGAGYSIAASASKNGRRLIGVILGATDTAGRYNDMISLFECGYSSFTTLPIDQGEFIPLYNETIEQIDSALLGTELTVIQSSLDMSSHITTTTARVSLGSTNTVDLSSVIIDTTSMDNQDFRIPVLRIFNDGKTYIVGVLNVRVGQKDNLVPVNPEKKTIWSALKGLLVTVIVILVLIIILIYALMIFRKRAKKRASREFSNKNKML